MRRLAIAAVMAVSSLGYAQENGAPAATDAGAATAPDAAPSGGALPGTAPREDVESAPAADAAAEAAPGAATPASGAAASGGAPSGAPVGSTPGSAPSGGAPGSAPNGGVPDGTPDAGAAPGDGVTAEPEAGPTSGAAAAPDAGANAPASNLMAPAYMRTRHIASGFDRYENALDAKFTDLYHRKASNFSSPTVMLSADWNYRYPSDTYVGVNISGVPQPNAEFDGDTTYRFSTYYGGLNLAQDFYESDRVRVGVEVMGGMGIFFLRTQQGDAPATIQNTRYRVVEPSAFVTFLRYGGMDIGAVASFRTVSVFNTAIANNADVSSATYGVTFRRLAQ